MHFHKNLRVYVLLTSTIGLLPYYSTGTSQTLYLKRYYCLEILKCILFHVGNELNYALCKLKYNYFGWILVTFDWFFVFFWLMYFFLTNASLVKLFALFEKFDNFFKAVTGRQIHQRPFHKHHTVLLVYTFFFMDMIGSFGCFYYMTGDIKYSTITSMSRCIDRSFMPLFLSIYVYMVYSVKIRFRMLAEHWDQYINACQYTKTTLNLSNIRGLHFTLINILENVNICFGTRLVIFCIQLFYLILVFFYLICTKLKIIFFLLPFYLAPVFVVTLSTQSMYSSMNMVEKLLQLPLYKVPEAFLVQMQGFILLLRSCPMYINGHGFFNIDQKLLSSMITALATYLVAIFQIAPLLENIQRKTTISLL